MDALLLLPPALPPPLPPSLPLSQELQHQQQQQQQQELAVTPHDMLLLLLLRTSSDPSIAAIFPSPSPPSVGTEPPPIDIADVSGAASPNPPAAPPPPKTADCRWTSSPTQDFPTALAALLPPLCHGSSAPSHGIETSHALPASTPVDWTRAPSRNDTTSIPPAPLPLWVEWTIALPHVASAPTLQAPSSLSPSAQWVCDQSQAVAVAPTLPLLPVATQWTSAQMQAVAPTTAASLAPTVEWTSASALVPSLAWTSTPQHATAAPPVTDGNMTAQTVPHVVAGGNGDDPSSTVAEWPDVDGGECSTKPAEAVFAASAHLGPTTIGPGAGAAEAKPRARRKRAKPQSAAEAAVPGSSFAAAVPHCHMAPQTSFPAPAPVIFHTTAAPDTLALAPEIPAATRALPGEELFDRGSGALPCFSSATQQHLRAAVKREGEEGQASAATAKSSGGRRRERRRERRESPASSDCTVSDAEGEESRVPAVATAAGGGQHERVRRRARSAAAPAVGGGGVYSRAGDAVAVSASAPASSGPSASRGRALSTKPEAVRRRTKRAVERLERLVDRVFDGRGFLEVLMEGVDDDGGHDGLSCV
ncbi:hypothetical protein DFJ73DRAFT_914742 [Zopfochytrium polystomum]|nr:hypothetical protein DFJ73DRAFT_914742 [Zopfochytrium polystomum]